MKVRFEHDISHNYMIPEPECEEENLSEDGEMDYEVHMLEENQIRGFMRCIRKRINGKIQYYYEITSKHSLAQICETESLGSGDIQKILGCLYGAMQQMEQYLLDGNKLVLDPTLIYLDIESREAEFCYLPSCKKNIQEGFRSFASYLLYHLNQTDTEAVLRVYEMNRKVQDRNYALLEILQEEPKVSDEAGKNTEPNPFEQKKNPVDVQQGILKAEEKEELPAEKEKDIKKQKREWKKEVKKVPKQKTKNRKTKKETRKEHPERKMQMMTGIVYLVVMGITGMAAWMDLRTVTQAGGITFLITAALAYALSSEKTGKKKDRQEKRKETGVRWELPEREEEPWMMEGKSGNTENHQIHEQKQNTEVLSGRKAVQEVAKGKEGLQNMNMAQPSEENVGATTLLWKGEEEYQPRLTLISMNPRERNSIVLVKDSYVIGKLKTKTDICLEEEGISRIHARIRKEGEEYYLYDMNSTNGTFINGRRLGVNEKVPLHVSDEIAFARTEYYIGNC